jgi:ornithine cyclodeaminase/alanine dehydrogenase-like protein (mu-crystallin family)
MSDLPDLRYLSAGQVESLMPPVGERIDLARRAMVALVADADLPPKMAVHPRPEGSFAHAMPAVLRGESSDGSRDLVGMKWVAGFPGNRVMGLPAIHGTVVLNEPRTGVPIAFVDAGPITAHRTAAVSGVAISAWRPDTGGRAPRVAVVGCGVQARSHLPVVAHLLPGSELIVFDRHRDRAEAVADQARGLEGIASARVSDSTAKAVEGSDVVLTMVSFGPHRQAIPAEALAPAGLIVAIDYDMSVPASVARSAALFVVDEAGQFLANRDRGVFAGYPDPAAIFGEMVQRQTVRPEGMVLATHLGVGLADLVFADELLRRAESARLGTVLAR